MHCNTVQNQYTALKRWQSHSCGNSLLTYVSTNILTYVNIPHRHTTWVENRTRGTHVDERKLSVVWPCVHVLLRYLRTCNLAHFVARCMLPQVLPDRTWPDQSLPITRSFASRLASRPLHKAVPPLDAADIIPFAHESERVRAWRGHDHVQDMAPFTALGVVKHLVERVVPRRPPLGRHGR